MTEVLSTDIRMRKNPREDPTTLEYSLDCIDERIKDEATSYSLIVDEPYIAFYNLIGGSKACLAGLIARAFYSLGEEIVLQPQYIVIVFRSTHEVLAKSLTEMLKSFNELLIRRDFIIALSRYPSFMQCSKALKVVLNRINIDASSIPNLKYYVTALDLEEVLEKLEALMEDYLAQQRRGSGKDNNLQGL